MSSKDLHEVEVHHHTETDLAWLLSDDGDEKRAEWFPKSQVTLHTTNKAHIFILRAPEWLLEDKGFL